MKNTPLVRSELLEKKYNIKGVYLKDETCQPTGSHKDRETEKIMDDLRRKKIKDVGIVSSGNAGLSLAAFSFANGIKCHVYLPRTIPAEELSLIKVFKPEINLVGKNYSETYAIGNKDIKEKGYYNANPGVCKLKMDGDSEIGKEVSKLSPTIVICPTNNGTLIYGVWKGLKESGLNPKMIASIMKKSEMASSIRGFAKSEGLIIDDMIAESKGKIIEIMDDEIKEALIDIAREGIFCEPSSAASVAALKHLNLSHDNVVVCIITGTFLKFYGTMENLF